MLWIPAIPVRHLVRIVGFAWLAVPRTCPLLRRWHHVGWVWVHVHPALLLGHPVARVHPIWHILWVPPRGTLRRVVHPFRSVGSRVSRSLLIGHHLPLNLPLDSPLLPNLLPEPLLENITQPIIPLLLLIRPPLPRGPLHNLLGIPPVTVETKQEQPIIREPTPLLASPSLRNPTRPTAPKEQRPDRAAEKEQEREVLDIP